MDTPLASNAIADHPITLHPCVLHPFPPSSVSDPTDLGDYGAVEFYDKSYDKLTARQEKPLERTQVSLKYNAPLISPR